MFTAIFVFAIAIMVVGAVCLLVQAIERGYHRAGAATQLEECMDRNNVTGVRSLLLVRGHLLRKDVREAAQVWLIEKDNAAADKKGGA